MIMTSYLFPGQNEQDSSCPRNNCGYARVAIWELTVAGNGTKGGKQVPVDKTKQASEFQHLFESSSYGVPSNYFEAQPKSRPFLTGSVMRSTKPSTSDGILPRPANSTAKCSLLESGKSWVLEWNKSTVLANAGSVLQSICLYRNPSP